MVDFNEAFDQFSSSQLTNFETPLTSDEETKFQDWKKQYAPKDSGYDYDLRGAFKEGITPDAESGHWPDTYKKPNHATFSDQSIYAVGENQLLAGHWEDEQGNRKITGSVYVPPPNYELHPLDTAELHDPGPSKETDFQKPNSEQGWGDWITSALSERHRKDFGEPITDVKSFLGDLSQKGLFALNFIAPGRGGVTTGKTPDISHYELQPLKDVHKEYLGYPSSSAAIENPKQTIIRGENTSPGEPANENLRPSMEGMTFYTESGKPITLGKPITGEVPTVTTPPKFEVLEGGGVKSPGGNPQPMEMQQHQGREEYMREYQKNYNRTDDRSLRYPIENSTNKWGEEGSRMGPGDNWRPNMNLINKVAEGLKQGLPHKEIAEQLGEGYTAKDISNVSYFMRNKLNMDVPKYNEVKPWTGTEVKALKEHYEQGGNWKDFPSERSVESIKKRASVEGLTKSNVWSEQETAALKDWFTKGNNPSLFPSDTRSIDALILKARQLGYLKGK